MRKEGDGELAGMRHIGLREMKGSVFKYFVVRDELKYFVCER